MKTAVDILYKFLYEMESFEGFDPYDFNQKKVFAKAKQIEKEQIMESWKHGNLPTFLGRVLTAEEYYNETFKSE
jgi:hypothetical protein